MVVQHNSLLAFNLLDDILEKNDNIYRQMFINYLFFIKIEIKLLFYLKNYYFHIRDILEGQI